ncbi:hypothetical protein J3E72DRAFT_247805 [Bipolaris maydis]|nr:hypothetical protein J3E72DRAFT_247805 [Bipolaris maydis]KAJ6278889.1 hypothetical protein J3E71DRAFT_355876 [Bipolaris maydis]
MPTDGDIKPLSESQQARPGLLAKCGIVIPTFFVRGRHTSPEDPNRLVMTADSPKKRKRATSSHPTRKVPFHLADMEATDQIPDSQMPQQQEAQALAKFDQELKDATASERYGQQRSNLLQVEEDNAWDREAKPSSDSTSEEDRTERRAATIIQQIREYERIVTFGNLASESLPDIEDQDMGGQFLTNKERIDKHSKLFEISKMVPKGGLLHLHFNAELHPEILLVRARTMKNMYIRSIQRIQDEQQLATTELIFNVLDPETINPNVDIFSTDYPLVTTPADLKKEEFQKQIWMPWAKFQDEFEKKFPGQYLHQEPETFREGQPHHCGDSAPRALLRPAENWLRSKMVLSQEEAYRPDQTVNGVWARFNQATRAFKGLLNYKSVYVSYISDAIDRMIEEGVMYAELRPMLLDKFIPGDSGKPEDRLDNAAQMKLIIEGVEAKKAELRQKGEIHKFPFGLKIIYCTPRSIPPKMMENEMRDCIKLKIQFPKLICGFDLVGAEDRPNHIDFYRTQLVAFKETCKALNLEIPFMFHAGETLLDTGGSNDPTKSNLYDAVALNSQRIGHGFALMKHPHLLEKFRKTDASPGICIELCPISNELLHLCRNVKEHPYPELLAAGIPCTVNSDNPSLFSNSMSHEFYQVMVGAPSMSLYSWKQLARWSIDYSCLSVEEKVQGHGYLKDAWVEFCKAVVDRYDFLLDGDRIDAFKAEKAYPARKRKHPDVLKALVA